MPREGAGVQPFYADDTVAGQPGFQSVLCAPAARQGGALPDDKARHPWLFRFLIPLIDPRITDLDRRHDNDLTMVGWIGEDLLVAGHAGVENYLPHRFPLRTETPAAKHGSIGKGKGGTGFVVFEDMREGRHLLVFLYLSPGPGRSPSPSKDLMEP